MNQLTGGSTPLPSRLCVIYLRDVASLLNRPEIDGLRLVSRRVDELALSRPAILPRRQCGILELLMVSWLGRGYSLLVANGT